MPRRNRTTVVHPAALREVCVVRVEDVTPGLRRVTLAGDQLGAFHLEDGTNIPEFVSTGFDDDIRMIFRHPGHAEPVLPFHTGAGRWQSPKDPRPLGRYYTVRRYDRAAGELVVDFVKHGFGVAASWAYRTQPGDTVHLGGPSASQGLPDGFDWLLVAGDDTAAPAIARLLDELPEDARAQVFLEVADVSHQQPLRELPGVKVTWLHRDRGQAHGSVMTEAVRSAAWWDGSVYAWVAGEQAAVRDVRRHLVKDRKVPTEHIDFTGYWKRAEVATLEADPELPGPAPQGGADERFHQQAQILPPLAIRAAVDLGLAELMMEGVRTTRELASRTGASEVALGKLLRYLETIDLVVSDGGVHRLTECGEELADSWIVDLYDPRGVAARLEHGLLGLSASVRTGDASLASVTGTDFATLRDDPDFSRRYLDGRADAAAYVAGPLAGSVALQGVEHVVLHADAAGALAAALTAAHPQLRVTIVAGRSQAAWLRSDLPAEIPDPDRIRRVAVVDPGEGDDVPLGDAVLVVDRLVQHPDAEAVELLRHLAGTVAPDGKLLVFEEALDVTDLDDHAAEADLVNLTVHGSGFRTADEVDRLIASAGLTVAASDPVVWGDVLRTVRPG